jgi:hypothetical protein
LPYTLAGAFSPCHSDREVEINGILIMIAGRDRRVHVVTLLVLVVAVVVMVVAVLVVMVVILANQEVGNVKMGRARVRSDFPAMGMSDPDELSQEHGRDQEKGDDTTKHALLWGRGATRSIADTTAPINSTSLRSRSFPVSQPAKAATRQLVIHEWTLMRRHLFLHSHAAGRSPFKRFS